MRCASASGASASGRFRLLRLPARPPLDSHLDSGGSSPICARLTSRRVLHLDSSFTPIFNLRFYFSVMPVCCRSAVRVSWVQRFFMRDIASLMTLCAGKCAGWREELSHRRLRCPRRKRSRALLSLARRSFERGSKTHKAMDTSNGTWNAQLVLLTFYPHYRNIKTCQIRHGFESR